MKVVIVNARSTWFFTACYFKASSCHDLMEQGDAELYEWRLGVMEVGLIYFRAEVFYS